MPDLDEFADIYLDLMGRGRKARAEMVPARLMVELAGRLPVADLADAIMATEAARGLTPRGTPAARRAGLMARLVDKGTQNDPRPQGLAGGRRPGGTAS